MGKREFSKQVISNLKKWGTNVVKIGISYDSSDESCQEVYSLMDDIIEADMYAVITFWSSPNLTDEVTEMAKMRFNEIATRYKNIPNVIYEIANEPSAQAHTWDDVKKYANTIIPIIRNISADSLILCPTLGYGVLNYAIESRLEYENVMYVTHIYNGNKEICSDLSEAILNGLPVFISEWSNRVDNSIGANDLTDKLLALMDRYNISSTFWMLTESTRDGSLAMVKQNMYDGTLNEDTLTDTGLYYKRFITKQYGAYKYNIDDYTMANGNYDYGTYFWNEAYRTNISKIITTNNFTLPQNIIKAWDMSNGSGNIISYIIEDDKNEGCYILYIATNGEKIYPTYNVSRLFACFPKLTTIDLSFLSTSNVVTMEKWFQLDYNLKEIIGLNNFDTSKVENMDNLFSYCNQLEELDFTSFDFSKVTIYNDMFYGMKNGVKIYVRDLESAKYVKAHSNAPSSVIYYGSDENWTEYIE